MIGLHVTTLGCKLNQLDSAELAGALRGTASRVEDPSGARLVIVNTCTVTAAADSDARQILRRRRRESPHALIVATGCYAERKADEIRAMPEVDLVLRREDRPHAAEVLLDHLRRRFPEDLSDGCAERVLEDHLPDFGERSRAYLRVQEGCDLRCSYCIIPEVRGVSRSVPPEAVRRRLRLLLDAGFREVVLTGVNTGDYGKDLEPRTDLATLLGGLASEGGDFRLRLNSVEPRRVTRGLMEVMERSDKIARHLQVPLQSGSDRVLGRMRRNYRTGHYRRVIQELRSRMPDIGLGADVIAGFPGESAVDFDRTVRFIRSVPLNYLHVFSYSPRPGTPAADSGGQVDPGVIRDRSLILRDLGREISREFRLSQAGRPHRALVLRGSRRDGRRRGLTSNFIEVSLDRKAPENEFVDVRLARVEDSETIAVQL